MSKGIYNGAGGVSHKSKKLYIGANGVSHKVKKGYIGIAGQAKQFYTSGFKWSKYTVVSSSSYELKLVSSSNYRHYGVNEDSEFRGYMSYIINNPNYNTLDDYVDMYSSTDRPTVDRSGNIIFTNEKYEDETQCRESADFDRGRGCIPIYYNENMINNKEVFFHVDDTDKRRTMYDFSTGKINWSSGGYDPILYMKNSGPATCFSYSSSDTIYDGGGYSDHICIRKYQPEKVTNYSRGTHIGDVESDNPSAYPSNGRHSDGYWYVFQGEA